MTRKLFTPQSANERLPLVRKIVSEILEKGKLLRKLMESHKGEELSAEILTLKNEIESLLIELEELGCFYKDWNFEIGLVDFPAIIGGQNVFLCWRSDEKNIQWFHGLADGYTGRKQIPPEFLN